MLMFLTPNVEAKGLRAFAQSRLSAGLGHVTFATKRQTQHYKKAVKVKLPLHQITKIFYCKKTVRLDKTKTQQRAIKRSNCCETIDRTLTNYRRAQRGAKPPPWRGRRDEEMKTPDEKKHAVGRSALSTELELIAMLNKIYSKYK
jgi:hypothetical protein